MIILANLNPLRRLAPGDPFARDVDAIFKGVFPTPRALNVQAPGQFLVDVTQADKPYQGGAEMRGFHEQDIAVSGDADQLAISAVTKPGTAEKEGHQVDWKACCNGLQSRRFKRPQTVDDAAKTSARQKIGVLILVLPYRGHGKAKKIGTA